MTKIAQLLRKHLFKRDKETSEFGSMQGGN